MKQVTGTKADRSNPDASGRTRRVLEQFREASKQAEACLANEEYQQAMALFFEASQSADEMHVRFLSLMMKTAPTAAHRSLVLEVLGWRLRYFTAQYDYHLAVAQTLQGLPREEWVARLETILVLSQSLVGSLLPILKEVKEPNIRRRIEELLSDWVIGVERLVSYLKTWSMASAQASRVLEWAYDNGLAVPFGVQK
ncbi:MAG: hypothetical protein GQ580_07815 [Candidatus Thorarchaeota archaeon]|nr:hypothetical protein [Candidatus Thorarchaeota archaeon]